MPIYVKMYGWIASTDDAFTFKVSTMCEDQATNRMQTAEMHCDVDGSHGGQKHWALAAAAAHKWTEL